MRIGHEFALCRQVLKAEPAHAHALHLLGVVLHAKGDLQGAIDMTRQAVAADGGVALYHSNLGEMYRQAGRIEEAISEAGCALALEPRYAPILNNLGIARYDRDEYDHPCDTDGTHRATSLREPKKPEDQRSHDHDCRGRTMS